MTPAPPTDAARLARAAHLIDELRAAWPREALRDAEAFLVETEPPPVKVPERRPRW